ncbi:uncharacterized protein UDID_05201 [Ustilago sp. UG-2017a]|nr:uncharacterized protein UDID_05201 [Ustilago sp. UG-2017a]
MTRFDDGWESRLDAISMRGRAEKKGAASQNGLELRAVGERCRALLQPRQKPRCLAEKRAKEGSEDSRRQRGQADNEARSLAEEPPHISRQQLFALQCSQSLAYHDERGSQNKGTISHRLATV